MEKNPLYHQKYDNFRKALSRQEGDYVPNAMANNGGFLFCTDKGLLTRGDINPTLIACYNFAHEYSKTS